MRYFPRQVMARALTEDALHGRMAFIAGPRQVGKTTAIQRFLAHQAQPRLFYNWDTPTVKRRFAGNPSFFVEDLPADRARPWVAFDEIHKYPKWKNLLKGYYDEWRDRVRFVVTGSARLELFRRSGDSLVGRYLLFHMLPLGVREVVGGRALGSSAWAPGPPPAVIPTVSAEHGEAVEQLLRLTGFPEPLAVGTERFYRRWRDHHLSLIVGEDLRDLTRITQIRKLETLLYLLPDRVGAPLSVNALRSPLEAAYGSLRAWLDALKAVYLVFSIPPWTARLARAILKEQKYYCWDWGAVAAPGPRFENFLAVQLQRAVAAWNEQGLGEFRLYYVRTKDGVEVDFAVADRTRVYLLVEAKDRDTTLSPALASLQTKVRAPLAVQVVNREGVCVQKGPGLYVMGADRFLNLLP